MNMTAPGWDIIGDVHGHCVKLEMLLTNLGYRRTNGTWRHPHGRQACYLGDLIDRGPDQIRTLALVRGMVEANEACCVMGNHEYNAIQYHMGYRTLKEFDDPHEAFLKEAPKGSPAYREWVDWFRNLPLWLDLKEFRVIHACWDPTAMSVLRKKGLGEHAVADESLLKQAGEFWMDRSKDSTIFHAFETLLKGIEIPLPEGVTFKDKDGLPITDWGL